MNALSSAYAAHQQALMDLCDLVDSQIKNRALGAAGLSSGAGDVAATLSTSLTGENNDITFTAVDLGEDGNDISVTYRDPGTVSASLGISVVAQDIVVDLATDVGLQASTTIGSGDNGVVTITADDIGTAGNFLTVTVANGAGTPGQNLSAAKVSNDITVTLGYDAGTAAHAVIGSGDNGAVTVTSDTVGSSSLTIEVVVAGESSAALSAAKVGDAITVTLGTDGDGLADSAKNTATLVAAAVTVLADVSAVASGTGASALTVAEGPTSFTGGVAPALSAAKNTATLVAGAVTVLSGVSAVASGTGGSVVVATPQKSLTGGRAQIITTVASDIVSGINEDEDASLLVTAANKAGNSGAGRVTSMVKSMLSGGDVADPAKIEIANTFNYLSDGVFKTKAPALVPFTAVLHDIAAAEELVQEAVYLLTVNSSGTVTVTKGGEASGVGNALLPERSATGSPIGYVRIAVDAGETDFDATSDSLSASHLTVTYTDCGYYAPRFDSAQ